MLEVFQVSNYLTQDLKYQWQCYYWLGARSILYWYTTILMYGVSYNTNIELAHFCLCCFRVISRLEILWGLKCYLETWSVYDVGIGTNRIFVHLMFFCIFPGFRITFCLVFLGVFLLLCWLFVILCKVCSVGARLRTSGWLVRYHANLHWAIPPLHIEGESLIKAQTMSLLGWTTRFHGVSLGKDRNRVIRPDEVQN